jgi:hypothetical protein
MQSELPPMLNVFETDYELQYSESYTGTTHQEAQRLITIAQATGLIPFVVKSF